MTEPQWKPKLSQSAPTLPYSKPSEKEVSYGVTQPISAPTTPSVYNKKLSKLFRGRLLVLYGDFTVSEALLKMAKFNVSSVPVVKTRKDTTILGFVDVLDFLAYLCQLLETEGEVKLDTAKLKAHTEEFKKTKISKLVNLSGRNPFYTINGEESLSEVVGSYFKGVHRIAITDENGDITGVVSQWTIANYLATVPADDKEWIPSLREPIGNANFTREVTTANLSEITLDCFCKMYRENLSALAIVDNDGSLCGNLSSSDLKGFQLYLNDFNDLLLPVSEFLSIVRKKQGRAEDFTVTVTPDTLVCEAVKKFNDEFVHRTYIVDENFQILGVFSLTDLMQNLVANTHTFATFAKKIATTAE